MRLLPEPAGASSSRVHGRAVLRSSSKRSFCSSVMTLSTDSSAAAAYCRASASELRAGNVRPRPLRYGRSISAAFSRAAGKTRLSSSFTAVHAFFERASETATSTGRRCWASSASRSVSSFSSRSNRS
eukprot:scaffold48616_cov69-Phaeocystis_antarctica.AAC.2